MNLVLCTLYFDLKVNPPDTSKYKALSTKYRST